MRQYDVSVINVIVSIPRCIAVEISWHNTASFDLDDIEFMTTESTEYNWIIHNLHVTMRQFLAVKFFLYCNLTVGLLSYGKIYVSCLRYKLMNFVRKYRNTFLLI